MPRLYYTPTSCGAASFISAFTAGLNIQTEQVDLTTHVTSSGADFYGINPKGNVPTLVLDSGVVLNENAAVLQYLADLASPGVLAPTNGSDDRFILQNLLSYFGTEVQPQFGGAYTTNEDIKAFFKTKLVSKFDYLEKTIVADKETLIGTTLSVADYYLYILLSAAPWQGIDLSLYPKVKTYYEQRIKGLESVQNAHARMATNPSTVV